MEPRLTVHPLAPWELGMVADMNLQLQRDEGSHVMPQEEAVRRLSQWLAGDYVCHLYRFDQRLAGYVLYRPTDPDTEGHRDGVYIRQFFILPEFRRQGLGRAASELLVEQVLPPATYITLEAMTANPAGRAFWQALGFQEYCVRYERTPDTKQT